jgi:hypothetical protein
MCVCVYDPPPRSAADDSRFEGRAYSRFIVTTRLQTLLLENEMVGRSSRRLAVDSYLALKNCNYLRAVRKTILFREKPSYQIQ